MRRIEPLQIFTSENIVGQSFVGLQKDENIRGFSEAYVQSMTAAHPGWDREQALVELMANIGYFTGDNGRVVNKWKRVLGIVDSG